MNNNLIGIGVAAAAVAVGVYFMFSTSGSSSSPDKKTESKGGSDENGSKKEEKKYPAGSLTIFFGSQTGTAEGFARTLMEETKKKGFDSKTCDLEDFDYEKMLSNVTNAVFLMSTYGEGDPTDNAAIFLQWAKNESGSLAASTLSHLNYVVFGLGNKQYEHYNKMGIETDEYLDKLGGKRLMAVGLGDDDGTLEEDFDIWKKEAIAALVMKFHPDPRSLGFSSTANLEELLEASEQERMETVSLQYEAVIVPAGQRNKKAVMPAPSLMQPSTRHFFTAPTAKVTVSRELRNAHIAGVGSTKHLELDISGTGVTYETADNCAILPENSTSSVDRLSKALNYNLDDVFRIENRQDEKQAFPTPCSIRDALTKYYDIQGSLRHSVVSQLYPYVKDENQRNWLNTLLDKDNRAGFKEFMETNCISLVDLLTNELSSAEIPLSDFLHIVPYIQPRFYTISSSSSVYPSSIHITIGIMQQNTPNGKDFVGLCSAQCSDMIADQSTCQFFVRSSSFRLPRDVSTPIYMIGPGTGLAPMRALLQEREHQRKKLASGDPIFFADTTAAKLKKPVTSRKPRSNSEVFPEGTVGGKNTLFFGCKSKKLDYIYEDELMGYVERNVLDNLHLAFSRDQKHKHLMVQEKNAANIAEALLTEDAYVYVCGATGMGADVLEALKTILTTHGAEGLSPMSSADAATYVRKLQETGRYVQELWSV